MIQVVGRAVVGISATGVPAVGAVLDVQDVHVAIAVEIAHAGRDQQSAILHHQMDVPPGILHHKG